MWRTFAPKQIKNIGLSFAIVLISCGSLLFQQLKNYTNDPGLGWHLATGQWIFSDLQIPRIDPFLFYKLDRSWYPEQWLADLIIYALYHFGGWPLLYFFGFAVYVSAFIFLLYPLLLRLTDSYIYSALAAVISFKLSQVHFVLRPVLFNFPCFIAVMWLCCLSREFFERHWKVLFAGTFVLFAFWANVHPSFVFGLFILCLRWLSGILDHRWWGDEHCARYQKRFALLIFVAVLGTFLNPIGSALYAHIIWHGQSAIVSSLFTEWQQVDLGDYVGQLFITYASLIAFAFLFQQKISAFWFLGILVFAPYALSTIRIVPFFAMFAAPLLVWGIQALAICLDRSLLFKFPRLKLSLSRIELAERDSYRGYVLLLIIIFALFVQVLVTNRLLGVQQFGFSEKVMPVAAVEFLKSESRKREGAVVKVLNDQDWGGYITWAGESKVLAFIDDRAALLGDAFMLESVKALLPAGHWQDYAEKSDADYLMVRKKDAINYAILVKQIWPIVYRDDLAVIYDIKAGR